MKILTNKNDLINQFESIYEEIKNFKSIKVSQVTHKIRDKMFELGVRLFENWYYENIGTGYSGNIIKREVNGREDFMEFHGYLERNYLCCLGEVRLKRAYYTGNNNSLFPIEEEYSWLKDEFLPDIKELSCYVSMLEPYDTASEMMKKVGGIEISSSSLQKITKSIGERLVKKEDEQVNSENYNNSKMNKNIDLLIISSDGACINTENGWKEVKNGTIYQIKKNTNGELEAFDKSYISRIENCSDFGKRLYYESRRRHLGSAKEVVTIGDGAKWIWDMFGNYYPRATQIVDWYHATEHLWNIIELMYGNRDNEKGKDFEKRCEDFLYDGLISLLENTIIEKTKELGIKCTTQRYKNIEKEINYFKTNEKRMKYSVFEEKGFPIGSGVIEGACKHLVQIRLKRNGMKWSIKGAHDVLQLRCLYLSNRWNEVENAIEDAA